MFKKVCSILLVVSMFLSLLPTTTVLAAGSEYKPQGNGDYRQTSNNVQVSLKHLKTGTYPVFPTANNAQYTVSTTKTTHYLRWYTWTDTNYSRYCVNFGTATSGTIYRLAQRNASGIEANNVYSSTSNEGQYVSFRLAQFGDGRIGLRSNWMQASSGRGPTRDRVMTVTGSNLMIANRTTFTEDDIFVLDGTIVPPAVDSALAGGISVTTARDSGSSVTVGWKALPEDALFSRYEIFRSTSENGSCAKVGEVAYNPDYELRDTVEKPLNCSFTDTTVAADSSYYYYVRTVFDNIYAGASGIITYNDSQKCRVSRIAGLTAEETAGGTKISWSCSDGTSYDIQRTTSRFNTAYTDVTTVNEPFYVDPATVNGTASQYSYYRVRETGTDLWSEKISLENVIFGKSMLFYSPDDVAYKTAVDTEINNIAAVQRFAEMGESRYAQYFKPGSYTSSTASQRLNTIKVGYYTHVGGLGKTPDDVILPNVDTPTQEIATGGDRWNDNITQTFWRSCENVKVTCDSGGGPGGTDAGNLWWGVSQAAPIRRVHTMKGLSYQWSYGSASGGFAADNLVETNLGISSQQQWYTRNSQVKGTVGACGWNGFWQGMEGSNLPTTDWDTGTNYNWGYATNVATVPVIREKPFLYLDGDRYKVFVPGLRKDSKGISWGDGKDNNGMGVGYSLDIANDFFVAKEGDTAAQINAALDAGKHVFFTPGIYELDEPVRVTKENTVVLGTGYATLVPSEKNGESALFIDDVGGVTVAGLLFDAWHSSRYLLQVGSRTVDKSKNKDHSANPTLLADLFLRVGGFKIGVCNVEAAMQINSNDIIGDHFWIWRADHGVGQNAAVNDPNVCSVGWDVNTCKNGLIVNGDDVTLYALHNEHFQEYTTLWNGENGRNYFLQNETPYDAPYQSDYMSHGGAVRGYSQYKVANSVNKHYAIGLGIYDVFVNNVTGESMVIDNAIEVPNKSDVVIENSLTEKISGTMTNRGTRYLINGVGLGSLTNSTNATRGINHLYKYENGMATLNVNSTRTINSTPVAGTQSADDVLDTAKATEALAKIDLDPSDYTPASWAKLSSVKTDLERILALAATGGAVSQLDVDFATEDLSAAIDNLISVVSLKEKVASAKVIQNTDDNYTAGSWKVLQDAITAAEAIISGETDVASKADINAAIDTIDVAVNNLISAVVLKAKVASAKTIQQGNYTTASWQVLQSAITDAEAIIQDDTKLGSKQDIASAIDAIDAAISNLISMGILKDKVTSAKTIQKGNYTTASWQALQSAIIAAETVTNSTTAVSKSDIDNAIDAIGAAISNLISTGTLKDKVTSAKTIQKGNYTTVSWQALQSAITAAEAVINSTTAVSKSDVDAAIDAIDATINNLLSAGSLKDKVAAAKTIQQGNYATASWQALQSAITSAEAVINRTTAVSKSDIDNAIDAIDAAISKLISTGTLKDKVTSAKTIQQGNYTAASWQALQGTITSAEAVMNRATAVSKSDIDNAIDAIDVAISKLISTGALKDKVTSAKTIQQGNYTTASWEALQSAITAAEAIINRTTAVSKSDIDSAINAIDVAVAGLEQKDLAQSTVTVAAQTYTGTKIEPKGAAVVVKYGGVQLKEDTDYTLSWSNNTSAGTAKITISGKGDYNGTKTENFKINPKSLTGKVTVPAVSAQVWNGKEKKPTVKETMKDGAYTLKKGADYAVAYKMNTAVGKAEVTVTFQGNYTGSAKTTFKINPPNMKKTGSSVASTTQKQLKIKWKKVSSKAKVKYQVQCATNSSFTKNCKSVITTKGNITLKGLKAKTTYRVRVRTYKKVGGVKYVGKWVKLGTKKTK